MNIQQFHFSFLSPQYRLLKIFPEGSISQPQEIDTQVPRSSQTAEEEKKETAKGIKDLQFLSTLLLIFSCLRLVGGESGHCFLVAPLSNQCQGPNDDRNGWDFHLFESKAEAATIL